MAALGCGVYNLSKPMRCLVLAGSLGGSWCLAGNQRGVEMGMSVPSFPFWPGSPAVTLLVVRVECELTNVSSRGDWPAIGSAAGVQGGGKAQKA